MQNLTVLPNTYFQFKQFTIRQEKTAMKVTTDSSLFGAWIAKDIEDKGLSGHAMDIGTGTGLLTLMVAQKSSLRIDAVEIDKDAAIQAKENFEASPWPERIKLIEADIRQLDLDKKYDVIFSNPPFYENDLKSPKDQKNVAHHSESLKFSELVKSIIKYLSSTGICYLLLPFSRNKEVTAVLKQHELCVVKKVMIHQSSMHKASRMILSCTFQKGIKTVKASMNIKSGINDYSAEFIALLKDYYLHL